MQAGQVVVVVVAVVLREFAASLPVVAVVGVGEPAAAAQVAVATKGEHGAWARGVCVEGEPAAVPRADAATDAHAAVAGTAAAQVAQAAVAEADAAAHAAAGAAGAAAAG